MWSHRFFGLLAIAIMMGLSGSWLARSDGIQNGLSNPLPVANGGTGGTYYVGISIVGFLKNANFNSTADQAIAIVLPSGVTKFVVNATVITNASVSMTTAQGGIYDAASKGGGTIVPATQAYTSLVNTTDALQAATGTHSSAYANNVAVVYLSLTTPQGAAATADVYIYARPIP